MKQELIVVLFLCVKFVFCMYVDVFNQVTSFVDERVTLAASFSRVRSSDGHVPSNDHATCEATYLAV